MSEISEKPEISNFVSGENDIKQNTVAFNCKGCGFAEKDALNNQFNCYLGRIEKYRSLTTVEIESDPAGDFFEIQGIPSCRCYREKRWEHAGLPIEERIEKVLEERTIKADLYIELYDTAHIPLALELAAKINGEKIRPKKIHFLAYDSSIDKKVLLLSLRKVDYAWEVHSSRDVFKTESDFIDNELFKCATDWIWVVEPHLDIRSGFLEEIDRRLNIDLERFVILYGETAGLLTLSVAYKNYRGNELVNGFDVDDNKYELSGYIPKLRFLAEQNNQGHLIVEET